MPSQFQVWFDTIPKAVEAELRDRGIAFEDYPDLIEIWDFAFDFASRMMYNTLS
jgi:hypothetical protein